uniref:Uncharacterized protein n=1 Tax=Lepeophtheirus salmonis TaxID=72036 RepID=A0A0K2U7F6_LEPSM
MGSESVKDRLFLHYR